MAEILGQKPIAEGFVKRVRRSLLSDLIAMDLLLPLEKERDRNYREGKIPA